MRPNADFWTVEPVLRLLYFGQKNGIEGSVFTGCDFNTESTDTDYQSGRQVHVDGTLAPHVPLAGGLAGAGVSAYYHQEVSDDSGSGATLGAFEGRTTGLGPALSYAQKKSDRDTIVELEWFHEVETKNRLDGDIVWLKAVLKF